MERKRDEYSVELTGLNSVHIELDGIPVNTIVAIVEAANNYRLTTENCMWDSVAAARKPAGYDVFRWEY